MKLKFAHNRTISLSVLLIQIFLISQSKSQLINGRCYLRCPIPLQVSVKCGSNGVNYQNMEELLCAKILCFPDLVLQYNGRCEDEPKPEITTLLLPPKKYSSRTTPKPKPEAIAESLVSIKTSTTPKYKEISTSPRPPVRRTKIANNTPSELQSAPRLSNSRTSPNHLVQNNLSKSNVGLASAECLDDCVCGYMLYPVCGSNRITYGNPCILECIKKTCDPSLEYHHDGFCDKIFFGPPLLLKELTFFRLYSAEKGIIQ